jgi:hypothetical protein
MSAQVINFVEKSIENDALVKAATELGKLVAHLFDVSAYGTN